MSAQDRTRMPVTGVEADILNLIIPSHKDRGGYVYVVEFGDGTVKPGMTRNPRRRMEQHVDSASKFGVALERFWISPAHDDYWKNERLILDSVRGRCEMNGEYLNGITFEEVVEIAQGLRYELMSDAELEELTAAGIARGRYFMDFIRVGRPDPELMVQLDDPCLANTARMLVGGPNAWSEIGPAEGLDVTDDRLEVIEKLASMLGTSSESAVRIDHIDVLEATMIAHFRAAAIQMRTWAIMSGRSDLTAPVLNVPMEGRGAK